MPGALKRYNRSIDFFILFIDNIVRHINTNTVGSLIY